MRAPDLVELAAFEAVSRHLSLRALINSIKA
jgi:hypothetical protein